MRLLSITAGAANMFCGSCLRDNALARELLRRGQDVTLLPVYTPTRVDEENVSGDRVFLGGISVYLQQHLALFRKTPWLFDRIWDSTAMLKLVSKRNMQVNPEWLGALTTSTLLGERGFQRKEIQKLVHWIEREAPYDLVNLPNALLIGLAAPIRRATGKPVCVTLQGEDLFLDGLPADDRRRALDLIGERVADVDLFISVSDYYRGFMSGYLGIPFDKIRVAPLGVTLDGLEPTGRTRLSGDPLIVGYLARVAPEKSLHLLAEAYRILRQDRGMPASRLEVAGYLASEHTSYLAGVETKMREWGLGAEFHYRGCLERSEKIRFLQSIDVLSVPSMYAEPKGLYLLEAMACGVPVVQPNHGAFPEILAKTGGGLLAQPNDPSSFADGLLAIARHPGQARDMGVRGAAGVREHYSVARMADRVIEVYQELTGTTDARPLAHQ